MWLMIDAGNTRVKWASMQADMLDALARAVTQQSVTLPLQWQQQGAANHADLQQAFAALDGQAIERIYCSNVAGATLAQQLHSTLIKMLPKAKQYKLSSQARFAGLHNHYANPAQLGTDRFASAIAARNLFLGRPVMVATCGTATTIDIISAEGAFVGGMILPGLQLMAHSLAQNTAQLPQVNDPVAIQAMFADHTQQAIVNGCIQAQVGAIERAFAEFSKGKNSTPACILSGGAASYLLPHLSIPHQHIDALVLSGLAIAAVQEPESAWMPIP